ncbi:MAG: DUF6531 domain-containing protein [Anaerolineae bacterium]|nr:DUF6531 domain-containing protein [Anaerolineae bacterium]
MIQPTHAQDEPTRSIVYGAAVGDFFVDMTTAQEWQFSGQVRDMLQVTVRRIGGRFTPRVELLAPAGNIINPTLNTADDYQQTLVFRQGLPEDGLYQLRVRGENAQALPNFLANDYSLTLQHIGTRLATSDEGRRPLPQQGLTPLPDLFSGQSFLAAPININIFGTATLSQPDPQNQRNRYIVENTTITVVLNNANRLFNGINAFALTRGGFAFQLKNSESLFFTDQNVTQLEFLGGMITIGLANGQLIETDFYRIAELRAVDGLVILRTVDNQRIILDGDNFNFRRRGGLNGEGPNAEPINIITVDGERLDTDMSGWQTLAAIRDGAGRYIRVEYVQNTDLRFIADTLNINLFQRGNALRPELNSPEVDTRLIDISIQREDDSLPLIIDPLGMGDVIFSDGNLQVKPLDGRVTTVASENVEQLIIENLAIRYQRLDGTYLLSLPDGAQIETPTTIADDAQALPSQAGYRPQFYNNLGTHIFDYHPDINFTRALMPVNLVNGNFYYAVEDFSVPSHTLDLNWTRYYNSLAPQAQTPAYMREADYLFGTVGTNWRHAYQIDLDIQYAPLGQVRLILPDGGTYLFTAIDEAQSRFRSQHLLSWTIERAFGLTGAWRATSTEGLSYDFDRAGRLQRITDAEGLSLTISPMPRQLAATYNLFDGFIVTDSYGRRLELYSENNGQIRVARGVQGEEIHYSYERQLLTDVEYTGANQAASYDYSRNLLTDIADTRSPYHQQMQVTYNENGQVLAYIFNPDSTESLTTQLTYLTENDNTIIEESRLVAGETRTHRWISDNLFRLRQWQMPKDDWSIRWNYDLETGRLSEYVLPTLAALRFTFDDLGYLTTYRDPVFTTPYELTYRDTESGMRLLSQIDYPPINSSLVSDTFVYDESNRLIRVTRPIRTTPRRIEQITEYAYDDIGRLSSISQVLGTEESLETVYTYDGFGYIQSISEGNGSRISRLRHDVVGRLRVLLDGRGTQYAIGWDDDRNLMTGLQISSDIDSETIQADYAYDAIGNLIEYSYQDARELYTYDGLNYLSTVTDALGRSTFYDYDEVGNLLSVTPLADSEQTISYTYDEIGMLASSTSASGLITRYDVSILFDSNRTRHRILYPTGEQYDYTYDAIGRLRLVTGTATQASSSENREIFDYQLTYDALGNLTQIVEDTMGGRSLSLSYDLLGNVLSSSIGNITTRYTYDRLGRLQGVTNPDGQTIGYRYDVLDNVVQVTMPDGAQHDYTYDANSNLLTMTNALGYESQFAYDSLNRLTSSRDPEGNITTYAYDTYGNLVAVTDPLQSSQTAEYDALGRLLLVQDALGQGTQFSYNDLDELSRITVGGGC